MRYTAEELVRLARRENNSIRPYLYVNPLQGKHIPADPLAAEAMCREAAGLVNRAWPGERLFVIGFAETATGIAACISSFLPGCRWYEHTTREPGGEALLFSEVHSHATDQRLRTAGLSEALAEADRVVLIDDEVTTARTICSLIGLLKERDPSGHLRFTILSLLNSVPEERLAELREAGIDCLSLCRIPHAYAADSILDVRAEPRLHTDIPPQPAETVPDFIRPNVYPVTVSAASSVSVSRSRCSGASSYRPNIS